MQIFIQTAPAVIHKGEFVIHSQVLPSAPILLRDKHSVNVFESCFVSNGDGGVIGITPASFMLPLSSRLQCGSETCNKAREAGLCLVSRCVFPVS